MYFVFGATAVTDVAPSAVVKSTVAWSAFAAGAYVGAVAVKSVAAFLLLPWARAELFYLECFASGSVAVVA